MADEATAWEQAVIWVLTKQRQFHRRLTKELRRFSSSETSGWLLILVSFLYGIFHAAGPGHGKAVLTTYLLTQDQQLKRGLAMATAAALMQGVTAILLVYGLVMVAGWIPRETQAAVDWTARVSFGLLMLMGAYLLAFGAKCAYNAFTNSRPRQKGGGTCNCDHTPSAQQIGETRSLRTAIGIVMAIGLRPCSGAVLMLIFAHVMKLTWAGVAAVIAMSIGTAMTVSTLALLAIHARRWAVALTEHRSPLWGVAGGSMTLLGGSLVFAIGLSLLIASFGNKHPLGLH
jgi:ABC-type nickel/cobalt efflux system permease component RcnA